MLVLTRKLNEGILIGDDIYIVVTNLSSSKVNLGINAPNDVPILRAENALGLESDSFLQAYNRNREDAHRVALEASPVVEPLKRLLKKHGGHYQASASKLLGQISLQDGVRTHQKGWPKAPNVLSATLNRLAPNLREIGIHVTKVSVGRGNDKHNEWKIRCAELVEQQESDNHED